jgi:hypothetical protein
MTQPQSVQSNRNNEMPYVTVGTDESGSVCWVVIEGEKITRFSGGKEAFKALGVAMGEYGEPRLDQD